MKHIVTITLVILVLLLMGVLFNYYREGDTEKLPTFLPTTIQTTQTLTLFQNNLVPTAKTVRIGPNADEEAEFNVISTQGQYLSENRKLALTVSIEEIDKDDYELYKEKVWERYNAPSRGGITKQETHRNREMYLSFREVDETVDDTSDMVVMGGGYVFFPEEDVVVTYSLYNPRLSACEDIWQPETCTFTEERELPTMEDARSIATQILDHYFTSDES
jgi:hypothetical protein